MINSKGKGKRFELELARRINGYGYMTRRTAQYCGNTGEACDLVGLEGIHIEAKHCEQMRLYDWMAQATRDSKKTGDKPVIFHRKNNCDILVTMRFDDWMALYGKAKDLC